MQEHSALHPIGPQAERIVVLWQQLAFGAIVVVVLVVAALLFAVFRRRRGRQSRDDRPLHRAISWAVGLSAVILIAVVVASIHADRSAAITSGAPPLRVRLIGHEWWWEVIYPDSNPQLQVTTANELHVPTGRPVEMILTSDDVIHSFWIPNVAGKMDLVPGRTNRSSFVADTVGTYVGNCAEFCGLNHARMRLVFVVQPPQQFAEWQQRQRLERIPPTDSLRAAGERIFLGSGCAFCHTVHGTVANGHLGPDLTHVGSRTLLAAGVFPNTPGNLATWITAPSELKPGTLMPPTQLDGRDVAPLISWLENLK